MRKILVTAISGDIGNGILKILSASKDCVLYGCDVNDMAIGMDMVHSFWKCKYAVEEGYIEQMLEKCKKYHITHLIPVNEREIEVIAASRNLFEKLQIKLVIQSENVLKICLDKYMTFLFLKKYDFSVPNTWLSPDEILDADIKYICKPRKSNGSKNIFIFSQKEEIMNMDINQCVIQEYIESDNEYTVGVFHYKNIMNVISFKRKLKNGYSDKVELVDNEKIYELVEKLVMVLPFEGYLNVQLKERNGIFYIFEINARISGTVRFRDMLGFHDLLWWLDILDGKEILKYVCPYSVAIGMRELNEKFLVLKK